MQINWFTVVAQIINFLILAWLLKKYLYHPILNAIDEREKKIAIQLEDAKAKAATAEKEKKDFEQKNADFDAQKNDMMNKAITEVKEEKQKLLDQAKNDANDLNTKLAQNLKDTQQNMQLEISDKIKKDVLTITQKTLSDIASTNLEEQITNIFINKLEKLSDDEKEKIKKLFTSGDQQILVKSSFELPQSTQTTIQKTVNDLLGTEVQFQFLISPEIISGIELSTNGYKLSWNIAAYLDSLGKNILENNTL